MPMKSPAPLPSEEISKAEIIENWALFLAVLGTIPWAIYLINDVFPRWDIRFMKLGILIFSIINALKTLNDLQVKAAQEKNFFSNIKGHDAKVTRESNPTTPSHSCSC